MKYVPSILYTHATENLELTAKAELADTKDKSLAKIIEDQANEANTKTDNRCNRPNSKTSI